jgi:anaerobic magnesium-protoporphyrin IX monomethyl ester cyclase
MKVLILSPPNSFNVIKEESSMENRIVPLDLATVGAVLKDKNHVKILDALALKLNKKQIVDEINSFGPDLVLLSPFDRCRWAYEPTKEILKEIEAKNIALIGGYNPEFIMNVMKDEKKLKFSTYGDPEMTLREITGKGKMEGVKGTIYRKENRIVRVPPREPVPEDDLPMPDRDLLQMDVYMRFPHENKTNKSMDIMVSRGCPYNCTYCLVKQLYGNKYRARSPKKVFEEISILMKKYNSREFHFMDTVFTMRRDWVKKFCLLVKPLSIEWSCQTRVDLVDREVLRWMKEAGCFSILYGIESMNPRLLENIKKGITPDDARAAVRMTREAGIETRLSFMFGLPEETPEIARKVIDEIIKLEPDFVQFHSVVSFPGTQLDRDIKRHGWGKVNKDVAVRQYDIVGNPFVPKGYRNREEVEDMRKYAYRRFYLRPSYMFRLLLRPSRLWRYVKAFNIYRKIMNE